MDGAREFIGSKILLPCLLAIAALTTLAGYSYAWNISNLREAKIQLALAEAKANWNKDAAFRKWATRHGGLYVKPDERTPPNPYLSHLPKRDLVTTDGTRLTLMNPAYMMRQMTAEFEAMYGIKGKITGKVQLNPINRPDPWELNVLDRFEQAGTNEVFEQQTISGAPYLRYMRAMYMTEGCVLCHGHLGFKDGDLRGGVSVSIPLTPYFEAAAATGRGILKTHVLVWLLGLIGIMAFTALARHVMEDMAKKALFDPMTQLPNASLFKSRADQAVAKLQREPTRCFAVCFVDLDRFKLLNDSYGHATGDAMLKQLAGRMQAALRPVDTVARMGGDEFLLLLDDVDGLDETLQISERVLALFRQPFEIGDLKLHANASIGICMSDLKYQCAADMIRDADIAMYRAKSAGEGCIDVFNPGMHEEAMQTMEIENDLRVALEAGQFEVHYQPVIDLKRKRIEGFEALLRWRHPRLGLVSPERFIPIAERSGQICAIGHWVLEQACRQLQTWNRSLSPRRPYTMAVNISGAQLADPAALEQIDTLLTQLELPREWLHLEVTETTLIAQHERARIAMQQLRQDGISVSIDDFGKGYCSLTYLQAFDFDTLKIDRNFVQDMDVGGKGRKLARSLILLARDLKMKIVAEGVENLEQLSQLRSMGCDLAQGYYFSRPLPATALAGLLRQPQILADLLERPAGRAAS